MDNLENLEKIIEESAVIESAIEESFENEKRTDLIKSSVRLQSTHRHLAGLFSKTLGSQITQQLPEILKAFFPCIKGSDKNKN